MSPQISDVELQEILDSRGNPTLRVNLHLDTGLTATADVPSGASTGSEEAVERRDGDPARYQGRGVVGVAASAGAALSRRLVGTRLGAAEDLRPLDDQLRDLDGTPNFASLGGNVAIGVSMAAIRAVADNLRTPLWQLINWLLNERLERPVQPILPVPHFNVINGGAHASNGLAFQEFMIAPLGISRLADRVRAGAEIYHTLRQTLADHQYDVGLGDEGGFAPAVHRPETALTLLVEAIKAAGYEPGPDGVAIALDPAANSFAQRSTMPSGPATYVVDNTSYEADELIDYYEQLIDQFPIWSIEDGLDENDWDAWSLILHRLGDRVQIMGDDLFVTNTGRIRRGIRQSCANSVLIKPNQVGTVSQTLDAVAVAYRAGWTAMVSHRSGETADTFVADLAVGIGCGQLKSGAPARGERTAKYNRLLEIAHDSDVADPYPLPGRLRPIGVSA
ncbi:enolase [Microlunatus endophyticus]|uniref:Enolase n=1 Tax=Microlunatus endophyticus TaxID=1716077 RepID=A0A917SG59_9ACTN|nr:phosphopyruvate hydratase [Microlunatus endophyticus]GGL79489.1 enolase [Microlunatus endophyticus]